MQHPELRLLIGGGWIASANWREVVNPFGEAVIGRLPVEKSEHPKRTVTLASGKRRAQRLSDQVERGDLSINHLTASVAAIPFGGVEDSGHGREGGTEGLDRYTVTRAVSHVIEMPA